MRPQAIGMRHLFFVLFLCITSCLYAAPAPATAGISRGPAVPDSQIERNIRARLSRSKIGRNGFQVRVQGGVATWEGKTSVIQHKGAATRMAKASGARAVVNNIVISEEARQKAAARLGGIRRAQLTTNSQAAKPAGK